MSGKCSKWQECEAFEKQTGCSGCSYQHFEPLLTAHPNNNFLKAVGGKLFDASSKRTKRGGRSDKPIREELTQLFLKELKGFNIKELPSKDLEGQISNIGVQVKVKCDGAFEAQKGNKTMYIFFELKGYGDDSNGILSAITAAQLAKQIPKFKDSLYYYIGVTSGRVKSGFTSESLRKGIKPYIEWAESKDVIWFYGIVEIDDLLADIKKRLETSVQF